MSGGLLDRLRRLLGGAPAPQRRSAAPTAPAPAGGGGAEAPPSPGAAARAGPEAGGEGAFAPFALALGVEVPPPPPEPAPEAEAALVALAGPVLEHFRTNRPGPASAPSLSLRILNLVAAPDADIAELSRLVSADPALAAGVLTVANSPNYRARSEVETVREAIARLGFDEVARIAGGLSARSLFSPRLKAELQAYGPRFAALYHRALTVAGGAAWLALQRRGGRSDRAFLGGMLHDVGKSVALRSVAALALAGGQGPSGDDPRLDALLDLVHLEVGGEAHQEWNLPQYLTVMAVRHHDAEVPGDEAFADLHAVRLASALLDLRDLPAFAHRAAGEVVQSAVALGLRPLQIRELATQLRETAQKVAAAFSLDTRRA